MKTEFNGAYKWIAACLVILLVGVNKLYSGCDDCWEWNEVTKDCDIPKFDPDTECCENGSITRKQCYSRAGMIKPDLCPNCDSDGDGKPDDCLAPSGGSGDSNPCGLGGISNGDLGGVVCKNGAPVASCVWSSNAEIVPLTGRLKACLKAHEDYHKNEDPFAYCPPCGWARQRVVWAPLSECEAWSRTLNCMNEFSEPLRGTEEDYIKSAMLMMKRYGYASLGY